MKARRSTAQTAVQKWTDEEYTFTIRGDLAKGIIIANCRAAEEALEAKKRFNNRYEALNKLQESERK